jgi:hypothetical protein
MSDFALHINGLTRLILHINRLRSHLVQEMGAASARASAERRIPGMKAILTLAAAAIVSVTPALAKPHLRDVAKIDDSLMQLGIADELRKKCDDIGARLFTALNFVRSLKAEARALGYTEDEIEDYVTSKAEKQRMRVKAEAWLRARGVDARDRAGFCAFGQDEIARGSPIGALLKAK